LYRILYFRVIHLSVCLSIIVHIVYIIIIYVVLKNYVPSLLFMIIMINIITCLDG